MTDLKISDMTAAGSLSGSEIAECVQSGSNKKFTFSALKAWVIANLATETYATNAATAVLVPTINNQTGTSYTLQTVDNDGKTIVRMDNAASNTCTIPSSQTKSVTIRQVGAGITTLVAGSGVTLNGTLVFTAANEAKSIVPVGGGVYDVYGAQ